MIGFIYKLTSVHTDKVYIGSSNNVEKRLGEHLSNYKNYKVGKYHYISAFDLFELGNVDIVILEEINYDKIELLYEHERFHLNNNICVNRNSPAAIWGKFNDKVGQANYFKNYSLKNINHIKEILECSCGSKVQRKAIARHLRTEKHNSYQVCPEA
mgnify:CR=1 FL=1